jgi:hypothetical protein
MKSLRFSKTFLNCMLLNCVICNSSYLINSVSLFMSFGVIKSCKILFFIALFFYLHKGRKKYVIKIFIIKIKKFINCNYNISNESLGFLETFFELYTFIKVEKNMSLKFSYKNNSI